jgi:hypothetical protein
LYEPLGGRISRLIDFAKGLANFLRNVLALQKAIEVRAHRLAREKALRLLHFLGSVKARQVRLPIRQIGALIQKPEIDGLFPQPLKFPPRLVRQRFNGVRDSSRFAFQISTG